MAGMTQKHTRRHHAADAWDAARADYLAGLSAAQAAAKHGLSPRGLFRRAAREGWLKRAPLRPPAVADPGAPGQASLSRQTFDMVADNSRILEVIADSEGERLDLIVKPDIRNLRQFVFRRAAEAAALGDATEVNAWLRSILLMDKAAPTLQRDISPFGQADLLRAEHSHALSNLTALFQTAAKKKAEAEKGEPEADAKPG